MGMKRVLERVNMAAQRNYTFKYGVFSLPFYQSCGEMCVRARLLLLLLLLLLRLYEPYSWIRMFQHCGCSHEVRYVRLALYWLTWVSIKMIRSQFSSTCMQFLFCLFSSFNSTSTIPNPNSSYSLTFYLNHSSWCDKRNHSNCLSCVGCATGWPQLNSFWLGCNTDINLGEVNGGIKRSVMTRSRWGWD